MCFLLLFWWKYSCGLNEKLIILGIHIFDTHIKSLWPWRICWFLPYLLIKAPSHMDCPHMHRMPHLGTGGGVNFAHQDPLPRPTPTHSTLHQCSSGSCWITTLITQNYTALGRIMSTFHIPCTKDSFHSCIAGITIICILCTTKTEAQIC